MNRFSKQASQGVLAAAGLLLALGAAQAQTVLKMGFGLAKEAHYGVGAVYMQQEIEKRTGGRYKLELFLSLIHI
jgi:TRAP-type C4-dicarboxylate transport system substrate-binding protein